jgi:predicted peptidase
MTRFVPRWQRLALAALPVWFVPLAVLGQGGGLSATLPATNRPAAGRTILPPLTGQAALDHTNYCDKICAALGRAMSQARTYTDPKDANSSLRYRLFRPPKYTRANRYPLVLILHGGGAVENFDDLLKCSSPVFAFGPARFAAPEEQARHPAFVVVPWSNGRDWDEENMRLMVGLLGALREQFPIDAKRLYITGQSMGGYGTWRMITTYPDLFAAAVPICGGGEPATAAKAKNVAVWAFHGTDDTLVPVSQTRDMISALLQAGARPAYWEYEGGTHAGTAQRAFCEPWLLDWLFAQAKP